MFALISICMSVAAQFALKAGVRALPAAVGGLHTGLWEVVLRGCRQPWLVAGLALYVASAALWLFVLAKWDVSKAYPLVGLGFALAVGAGLATGESVGWTRTLGVALIIAGVFITART